MAVFGGASALARAIGRSDGAIRKWLRGDSEPNVSDLRAICRASGASVEWLVTGEGDSQLIPGVRESQRRYGELRLVDDDLLEHIITAVDEEARSTSAENRCKQEIRCSHDSLRAEPGERLHRSQAQSRASSGSPGDSGFCYITPPLK